MSNPQNPQSGAQSSGPVQPSQPSTGSSGTASTSPVPTPPQNDPNAGPAQSTSATPSSGSSPAQTTSTTSSGTSSATRTEKDAQHDRDDDRPSAIGHPTRSGTTRVFMNESTCEGIGDDEIPFPVRQQLGNHMGLLDARSGNGVWDELGNPSSGTGRGIEEVDYHLDSTPPASEPINAPGTAGSGAARAVEQPNAGRVARTGGPGSEVHRQGDSDQVTVQRTQEGRDDRIMAAAERGEQGQDVVAVLDHDDDSVVQGHQKVAGDPDHTLGTGASHKGSTSNDVPSGSGNDVLKWVGNDRARARRALEVEQSKEQPRTTLIRQLNDKL
jgi:hypothetical protein